MTPRIMTRIQLLLGKRMAISALNIVSTLAIIGISYNAIATDKVVYGPDDRLDIFEVTDALHLKLANSTAAMIPNDALTAQGDNVAIRGSTLRSRGICAGEKFAEQITAANCSGFLVGKNLLVTAGHCIRTQYDCQNVTWVFDYAIKNQTETTISGSAEDAENAVFTVPKTSVYRCAELLDQKLERDTMNDYALIRLEKDVTDREPLTVRTSGKISDKENILVIGHPTGLPSKVANNAWVRTNTNNYYFVSNLDTFGGNSGSAVFNATTGAVEGILVRGENDYEQDFSRGCRVPKVCTNDGCRGEDVTRITNVKKLMDILKPVTVETPVEPTTPVVTPTEPTVPTVTVNP